jgi:hypothetical protein
MTQRTVAGSTFGLVAGAPATEDAAGYGALTPVLVGEITSLGDIGGEYNSVTTNNISSRIQQTLKGVYVPGTFEVSVGDDMTDAGQLLLEAAFGTPGGTPDVSYSFALNDQNGDVYYFQGLVTKFTKTRGDNDAIVSGTVSIAINSIIVSVLAT